MRCLPHEAWGPKCFFDVVTKVWIIYSKSERFWISNTRIFLFSCKWWFVDVSSLRRPFSYFFLLLLKKLRFFFNFCVWNFFTFTFRKLFWFFWFFAGGKSEQDRHSITKSSRTRVSNPQEIPIFYPAQPQMPSGFSNVTRRWLTSRIFCNIFIARYYREISGIILAHAIARYIARYRAISCDISRDGVCQNYPGYLAIISRDKDIAKYPTS